MPGNTAVYWVHSFANTQYGVSNAFVLSCLSWHKVALCFLGRHLIGICPLVKDMSLGNLNNLRPIAIWVCSWSVIIWLWSKYLQEKEHSYTWKNPKLFPGKQLQMEQFKKLMVPDHLCIIGCLVLSSNDKDLDRVSNSIEFPYFFLQYPNVKEDTVQRPNLPSFSVEYRLLFFKEKIILPL